MPEQLSDLALPRLPMPGRPLGGVTILLVEDSRFACEAIRLLGNRAGARVRRADSLRAAHRHLQTYRPTVVLCDFGLPDGWGGDFIAEIASSPFRPAALLGLSGDPDTAASAMKAGADGFLLKPVESLSAFQSSILAALDTAEAFPQTHDGTEPVQPDPLALRDDLSRAADALAALDVARAPKPDAGTVTYLAGFIRGVARIARDAPLESAAEELAAAGRSGSCTQRSVRTLAGMMRERLAAGPVI